MNKLIDKAKRFLKNTPIDAAHGFEHHKAVAENCKKIIEAEHLMVNAQAVITAAWWHDVESRRGATDLLEKEMKKVHLDKQDFKTIASIIHSHTYGKHQETMEAKVLFDADKIEYFNPQRLKRVLKDTQRGVLPVATLSAYYHNWLERHKTILESLHFNYSRVEAQRNLPVTKKEIEKIRMFLFA